MKTAKQNLGRRALTYFLVEAGQPILRVQKYFLKYNEAFRASLGLNCVVTNGYWLRTRGVNIEIQTTTKPRGAEIVVGVTFDGTSLASFNSVTTWQFAGFPIELIKTRAELATTQQEASK